jgi:hypothetical protein
VQHITAVRKIPGLQSAIVVFIPESNLGFEAIWQHYEIKRSGLPDVCVMHEDDNRAGVRTSRDLKRLMAITFNYTLLDGYVYFHRKFVCTGEQKTPEGMKLELIDQLKNYCRIIKPSNNPHALPVETYGGKSGYGFDDLALALQLNVTMKNRFFSNPIYKEWHR